jgi:hypothetical protein
MATSGIEAVFLETHNWGKAVRFFQALGYELDLVWTVQARATS